MKLLETPLLHFSDEKIKREEIKAYFLSTYSFFESLFDIFADESVFYKQSEPTRHPMIFYFGHTATFFINKLLLAGIIDKRVNAHFESMFAIGVDEMSWDDLDAQHYEWPSVQAVRAYRAEVKELVLTLIDTIALTSPISWNDPMWVILMGIEHEMIHIETSSVLHRQMPIEYIQSNPHLTIETKTTPTIHNTMITFEASSIQLGKSLNDEWYGWDNEYGTELHELHNFKASKYLVSNAEFMPFVVANGYENIAYWDAEGQAFLANTKAKHPHFWHKEGESFRYRSFDRIIDLPLNHPVEVNYLEAKAFLHYKNHQENANYRLPTEAEWMYLYQKAKQANALQEANVNFKHFHSVAVDTYQHGALYDVIGNVWQWSETHMHPFEGFKVHPIYDDFTTPTFDTKHNLIKGGSWASAGNELSPFSRYAFRRHFFQHAGFRYVEGEQMLESDNIYESDALISQYCEFQYGEEHFGIENFAKACASIAIEFAQNGNTHKALDIGCATGRASFELAKAFEHVTGIDFSARFIQVGDKLKRDGIIHYERHEEGAITSKHSHSLKEFDLESASKRVEFFQGDACNLKEHFTDYDLVLATNLIDRLYEPHLFLEDMKHRINIGGYLILTSPYTWLEEYTKKEHWLGGYINENGETVSTLETLKSILADTFEFIESRDVSFVIRETPRKYQHTIAQMSIFKKK